MDRYYVGATYFYRVEGTVFRQTGNVNCA